MTSLWKMFEGGVVMRDLVRPSASRASERCAVSAGGMVLFFALAMILWWASRRDALPQDLLDALWIGANVCVFVAINAGGVSTAWFSVQALRLAEQEESRAYSTGAFNPRAVRIVDPKSGLVFREANHPVLRTRQDVREARASASVRFNGRTAKCGCASGNSTPIVSGEDRE